MLRRLFIKNIALIENQTIEFDSGFSVFSGETGAGKSLIIDSILLVLGARADKTLISFGKDFAYVEALFDTNSADVKQALLSFGIEDDDSIVISRKIWADGRSDIRVNGYSVTLKMLKQLSSLLVDVYGQFENQTMFNSSSQLQLVDSFAGNQERLYELGKCLDEISSVDEKLVQLGGDETERERMLDMLSFQIGEIEDAGFYEGEEEELKQKHAQIVGREKVMNSLSLALESMDRNADNDVSDKLKSASNWIEQICGVEEKASELAERLSAISFDVKDVLLELEDLLATYRDDQTDIDQIEFRLDLLNKFKRKYGNTIADINMFCASAKEKYDMLVDSTGAANKLKEQRNNLLDRAMKISREISLFRQKASKTLSDGISNELADLGMKSARFDISVLCDQKLTRTGTDGIQFLFSANSGMPLKPLEKVASGGELSRFMLALKTVLGKHLNIGTMIFDEIDTGISGVIGRIVGEKLYAISKSSQVICVSHLAQIAALADNNFLIEKFEEKDKTSTSVTELDYDGKVGEVARLAGGLMNSEHAIEHARDLVESSNKFKSSVA